LNYTRLQSIITHMVEGEGFEPSKAEPSDLQSDPFDRSGTPPIGLAGDYLENRHLRQILFSFAIRGMESIHYLSELSMHYRRYLR
jgi:hypothetical protein